EFHVSRICRRCRSVTYVVDAEIDEEPDNLVVILPAQPGHIIASEASLGDAPHSFRRGVLFRSDPREKGIDRPQLALVQGLQGLALNPRRHTWRGFKIVTRGWFLHRHNSLLSNRFMVSAASAA